MSGSVQKLGDTCSDELRLTLTLFAMSFAVRPSCGGAGAIDRDIEIRGVDLLLEMGIGDSRNVGDPAAQLLAQCAGS